jgi:uncharacterized protein (TIGR02757 family)
VAEQLRDLLEEKHRQYNQKGFIEDDPVCIPHRFDKKQDIEISGFLAATLAWGQRSTIIRNCSDILERMDEDPHAFVLHHSDKDLKRFTGFVHRTFNSTDLLYFIHFFNRLYTSHDSMEEIFLRGMDASDTTVEKGLDHFKEYFEADDAFPRRTAKHVAAPSKKSACKRINMFLRWMVRRDEMGVDFGIWKHIQPHQLVCPCDLHVGRVARGLGLIRRRAHDWKTALELTENLRILDSADPVKYDFALFGLGVHEKYF